ncbi:hypothetical protein [Agromyces sp. M3QZ16-3]
MFQAIRVDAGQRSRRGYALTYLADAPPRSRDILRISAFFYAEVQPAG